MDMEDIIETQYQREISRIYEERAGESYEETIGKNIAKSVIKGIIAYTISPIVIYSGLTFLTDMSEEEKGFYSQFGNVLGIFFVIKYLREGIKKSRNHLREIIGDDLKRLEDKYYPSLNQESAEGSE